MNTGYQTDFLGLDLPLPTFSAALAGEIHQQNAQLRAGYIADYIHYSIVQNGSGDKRSPAFVALNINQDLHKSAKRRDNWRTDSRIPNEFQLNNDYYANNPWDRGHMARRTTAAWGLTAREAQQASNETFYFTNATLQHANLNQDEWLALENWVLELGTATDGLITSFSGPFYADYDRTIKPAGRSLARIPSGFFKVVCFKNKITNSLDVRAFVIYQDVEALKDKNGNRKYNNQSYQTTITEIENLTGLQFDPAIYHANPLFFNEEHATPVLNINPPEEIEVGKPDDIINDGSVRDIIADDKVDVYLSAALVNPEGDDAGNEWISITNFSNDIVDINDWVLEDNSSRLTISNKKVNCLMNAGDTIVIRDIQPIKLGNNGDVIRLYDDTGRRIDYVNYTRKNIETGKPMMFLEPRNTLK
jgi:endonuclease G